MNKAWIYKIQTVLSWNILEFTESHSRVKAKMEHIYQHCQLVGEYCVYLYSNIFCTYETSDLYRPTKAKSPKIDIC